MTEGCTVWIPWSVNRLALAFDRVLAPYLMGHTQSLDIETEHPHLLPEEQQWIEQSGCTVVALHNHHLAIGVEFSQSWMAMQFFLTWAKDSSNWRIS